MTRVDFYILPDQAADERHMFACRLASKAFRQGHHVYIHTASQAHAEQLSELLWSFRPASFIPHSYLGSGEQDPVAIGWGDDPGELHDVMINLDLVVPGFIGRFERVLEVVPTADASIRDALRQSWQHYKDRGYPVEQQEV